MKPWRGNAICKLTSVKKHMTRLMKNNETQPVKENELQQCGNLKMARTSNSGWNSTIQNATTDKRSKRVQKNKQFVRHNKHF
jgi:hypothetical protein